MRPTAALINIHEHLIYGLVRASHQQLTSDHEPACMCHCIFFRINPRVSKLHAFRLHRATQPSLHSSVGRTFDCGIIGPSVTPEMNLREHVDLTHTSGKREYGCQLWL